ncbi:MAG: hypothetical protein JW915_09080 [Chitinispirillaceae bacterium]|nr:hypothetical protein [Chitinispirillaceae bacterium]
MLIVRLFIYPVLLCINLIEAAGVQEISDDSLCGIANSSLQGFLEKIPPGFESKYGFSNRNEFKEAQPGTPLRMYVIEFDSNSSVDNLSPVALDEWRIPVMVNRAMRSLLTVAVIDGALKTVELGGAALAQELDQTAKSFQMCHRALLRVNQFRCDIMLINCKSADISNADCIPLKSATLFSGHNQSRMLSQNTVMTELLKAYKEQNTGNK